MYTGFFPVYTDFIDWLIFSVHWFFFSVYTDFIDWLIFSVHCFFSVHWFHWLVNFQCTLVFFQCTLISLTVQFSVYTGFFFSSVHWFCSVYTDFIDWLIFSMHCFFFSVHWFHWLVNFQCTLVFFPVHTDFIDWLIFSVHWFFSVYTDFIDWLIFSGHWFHWLANFQWTPFFFQCTLIIHKAYDWWIFIFSVHRNFSV